MSFNTAKIHGSVPATVAIVAMGRSSGTYLSLASTSGTRRRVADETWAINSMGGVIEHDLLFHMDDCKIQEARAEKLPGENIAGMMSWLQAHPKFMTSTPYDDYPGAVEYPLEEVINGIGGHIYLNGTVAYAVAYAIFIGVKKISMFGCDYTYSDLHKSESGRGCVEFLLGMASQLGIHIEIAQDSTLMDANVPDSCKPYGYDAWNIEFKATDNGCSVVKTPRDVLPTPEEIEKRYRH